MLILKNFSVIYIRARRSWYHSHAVIYTYIRSNTYQALKTLLKVRFDSIND